ncbi:MAG: M16 family metallopeptidase [Alphaproteobacteria bacterium]
MTKHLLLSAGLALVLAACNNAKTPDNNSASQAEMVLPAGFSFVEEVKKNGDEIAIPYKKFKLDNGLTVVLHQDKSDPLVHVDVTYHVGSGREDVGKSGFAHFFEHMMFQGSENVADEQHFGLITESGGTLNGSTNSDRTNYYETVPSNQLEKMLWLEADRMGYFLDAVTQKKFEVQRETVKNERGQNYDNRPYGLLRERVGEAMFPEGHPYSWSTIGYLEDLDRANVNDLKKFFLRWYGPNNAVLTIGGDLDEAETLAWVKKYFGSIPAGPDVDAPVFEPVTLDKDRYISMEDNVAIPLVYMAWPTVHVNHPDEAPLDVLMSILGSGKTSLLYKNLEKDGLAVQTSAGHGCRELSCEFTLLALPNPAKGTTLAEIESKLRGSLTEFETRGVEDDDLTRVKAGIVSGMIYGLESVSGKVSQLASYETFRSNPNGINDDIERYENVSKEDVMRVYETYIKSKPAVIMSIVPKGQGDSVAAADTWDRYTRNIPAETHAADFAWTAPEDDFDRSVIPPAGANPTIKVPPVYSGKLGNGMKVLGAVNHETPTTTISVRIATGQGHETIETLGLSSMMTSMLDEATTASTSEELSNRLDKLGSSVSFSSGDTAIIMRVRSLTENIDETIAIAAEKLLKPKFDQVDFDRVQANTLQGIKSAKKQASGVATTAFNRRIFGDDNAFTYGSAGTEESVSALTLDDVKKFYEDHMSASIASVIAVSDLGEGKMTKALAPLSALKTKPVSPMQVKAFPEIDGTVLYFLDKPGAAQSEIRIGKRALPFDATGEYYRAGLMNYVLGGAFNSRINLNLREDKGYTYGARSFFSASTQPRGYYRASAGVRSDATAASITEFVKEISAYQKDGITEKELAFTKSAIGQRDARAYETPSQKLGFLSNMMVYDLKPSFVDEQNTILANITKAEIDGLAAKHLKMYEMIMVVVGDKAKLMDEVKALGYPVVELDEDGNLK